MVQALKNLLVAGALLGVSVLPVAAQSPVDRGRYLATVGGCSHCHTPGHFMGKNVETRQRVDDEQTLSKDILSGKVKGEANARGMMGMNLIVSAYGVRINYSEKALE